MILHLHHRYRIAGGEERAVSDLLWLTRERLGEDAELLTRDSRSVGRLRAAAGVLGGGLTPDAIARAVRRSGARIVHAHNLHPTLGWRALAAAREAGAKVVLSLHQYRLVCAVGVCFTHGEECTRCHGRNTLPGVLHNCRSSLPEALTYAAGIAAWQPRLATLADAFVVPSRFSCDRLHELGAPVKAAFVVPHPIREFADASSAYRGRHALVVSRLAPEKGVAVAIEACAIAGIPLVIAGDGPQRDALTAIAGPSVAFAGHVGDIELARLRREAAVAVVPSRSAETFGLSAAEAMAAGVPVAASRVGAVPELVPGDWLAPSGDPAALAAVIARLRGDRDAGQRAIARAREVAAPDVAARALGDVYSAVDG